MTVPSQAEVVVVGGGVIGCAIAYHLTRLGRRDVLVVEQFGLTEGATWHAAGLVGQLRGNRNLTRLMQASVALYRTLEEETGQATGWREVGSLRIASSAARWQEIRRTATTARSFGFELHLISPEEASAMFPVMEPRGIVGAAFVPSDGYIDPSGLAGALARGARGRGAKIVEGATVTDIVLDRGRARQVVTDHGTVAAETVVLAAGMWTRPLAARLGLAVPATAVEHQYLVTEPIPGIAAGVPTFRDPDHLVYAKPEVGGLALGGWEPDTVPFAPDGIPEGFRHQLLPGDFDRFERLATLAAKRIPALATAGVKTLVNGPIPVSADGEPVLGLAAGTANVFLACGFTAGIAAAGGAGEALAEWIVAGHPTRDLWPFDSRRFGAIHAGTRFLAERAVEAYGRYYALHYPGDEPASARGARQSPLHETLVGHGAVMGTKFGWERPNWFAPAGVEPVDRPAFDHPNWTEAVAAEHRCVRERVALIDQTSFAKFELVGPGALATLQRLAANDVGRPPGAVTYTQLVNERGGIEADVTVSRLAEDRFYIVTGAGFGVHDGDWITRHLPADGSARLEEVTSAIAVINLCGPRARTLLGHVAQEPVDGHAFPFMTWRTLHLGYAAVRALRVTYTGELGWELHMPTEYAPQVYGLLREAGADLGVADVGYRAIDGLRLEKRYLYWSADITPDDTPFEAGLGFCVKLGKGDFLGREALLRAKAEGVGRRLCCFTLEAPAPVFGGEAILHAGRVVGVTTSGGFGHSVGKPIVLGYVPTEAIDDGPYAIEAFGEAIPATRHPRPLYDPARARLLG